MTEDFIGLLLHKYSIQTKGSKSRIIQYVLLDWQISIIADNLHIYGFSCVNKMFNTHYSFLISYILKLVMYAQFVLH